MHEKIINLDDYHYDDQVAKIIKISNRGLRGNDLSDFIKRANHELAHAVKKMAFHKGEVPIHLIALGTTESVGPNRNFDGFTTDSCRKYHHTFVKHAKFYRHHKNKDPLKSYGIIKHSSFNEEMQRIELIVALNATKEAAEKNKGLIADEELEKLASDDTFPVSMSCVTDPNTLIFTTNGYKRIEDIVVGDTVYTHKGNWKKVTELSRRIYSGEIVHLRLEGLPLILSLTADHPMFAKDLSYYPTSLQGKRPVAQWAEEVNDGAESFKWTRADQLHTWDRIAVKPVKAIPNVPVLDDVGLAQILGLYTAEGSIGWCKKRPNGVQFSVHVNDWATTDLIPLINSIWPGVHTTISPHRTSLVALNLCVNSAELAQWVLKFVGHRAENKRVPLELYGSSDDVKLAYMGRWLDGDGFCDKKGIHWSSINKGLILQGRDILLSMGIASSIYHIHHTIGYSTSSHEYTLNVSNFDAERFKKFSKKVTNSPYIKTGKRQKPPCLYTVGDQYAYRIKSIKRETVENIQTYNFEVEDDHSYSLYGTSSHNCKVGFDVCSICANKAPTRAQYCTSIKEGGHCPGGGCKNNLGFVDDDGNMTYVDNPHPLWFDISRVARGADRIAFVLGKPDILK